MTSSMSDFVGQPLTWRSRFSTACWDLIAPDKTIIASFPVEHHGGGRMGQRYKRAKALIRDGTGTLILNGHGEDKVCIFAVEHGPRLAEYRRPWLRFDDGCWFRLGYGLFGKRLWQDNTETTTYVKIKAGTYRRSVDIYPPAAELPEPQLSVLLVLGLYNMIWELRKSRFLNSEMRLEANPIHAVYHIFYEDREVECDCFGEVDRGLQ